MGMKIRLARGGSKKRPYYRIVAADQRMPRDGRFIEKLGTYHPLLPKDNEKRITMNLERIQYWLSQGAQPTDRIARFLEAAGILSPKSRNNLKKGEPGAKAQERAAAIAEKNAAQAAEAQEPEAEAEAEAEAAEAQTDISETAEPEAPETNVENSESK